MIDQDQLIKAEQVMSGAFDTVERLRLIQANCGVSIEQASELYRRVAEAWRGGLSVEQYEESRSEIRARLRSITDTAMASNKHTAALRALELLMKLDGLCGPQTVNMTQLNVNQFNPVEYLKRHEGAVLDAKAVLRSQNAEEDEGAEDPYG